MQGTLLPVDYLQNASKAIVVAQLIAGSSGDVKRDWGASPTSTRSVCLDTDTARTVTLGLYLIFPFLVFDQFYPKTRKTSVWKVKK